MSVINSSKPVFYDNYNFPYGFRKSGEFSIAESELLEQNGWQLDQLTRGLIVPETREDMHFLDVLQGNADAKTTLEILWLKYKALCDKEVITVRPSGNSVGRSAHLNEALHEKRDEKLSA